MKYAVGVVLLVLGATLAGILRWAYWQLPKNAENRSITGDAPIITRQSRYARAIHAQARDIGLLGVALLVIGIALLSTAHH